MGKLFLKLWLLLLVTSLTSFQIQRHVFDWTFEQTNTASALELFRRTFVLVEEALEPFPKQQWPARFERLKERVGLPDVFLGPSQLLKMDELQQQAKIPAEGIKKIRSQQIFSRELTDEPGNEIFKNITGTEYVVVLKAPYTRRQSKLILGLFTSTQFTWLVESSMYALAIFMWLRLFKRDMLTLEKAATLVGEGQFEFHIDVGKGAVLYPLADSFNKMKDRIGALIGSHRQLTNAISHEFRTPITRLRFRHELAVEATSAEEKDRQLHAMNSAIDQLDDLSTELLEYARLDRETPVLDIGPIDTVAWLNELADEARDIATAEGRAVDIKIFAGVESADGDHRYLSRAAANLLKNAVRHARSEVKLHFQYADNKHTLHVDDDGPGIPLTEREHLFEPFTRLDKSRDRQSGGFGMGLPIVKQIARWHGGSVAISESSLGGARLSLSW